MPPPARIPWKIPSKPDLVCEEREEDPSKHPRGKLSLEVTCALGKLSLEMTCALGKLSLEVSCVLGKMSSQVRG